MIKPKYIVFEGINGCGKGTQISKFEDYLYNLSKDVFVSRIRTPNFLDESGKKARNMLSSDGNPYENSLKALEYFGENHRKTAKHINKLLELGHFVISDRNYLSTFAFQGAQGIPYEKIAEEIKGSKIPDLTFLIDVPAKIAIERLSLRDGSNRRKFDKDIEFLEKVRENYLDLNLILPKLLGDESIYIINGQGPIDDVFSRIKLAYQITFKL